MVKAVGIKVTVIFAGALHKPDMPAEEKVSLQKGDTIEDLLVKKGVQETHRKFINATVNEVSVKQWHELKDGDRVTFFLPVGGG